MDPIPTTVFILMILFHLTNVISGASLGNAELFNETFDDAEEQHRTVLQNIQKNYADEFRNYEMEDIENFLAGFMTPVKKEKEPIYTSKTFFGSDQFFGARERSKGNSHHQTWDPFRANRVIGSQPSYFDVPDDLFQQYIYSKNNSEASSKTGDDNASDFLRGIEDLSENKDEFPSSEISFTDKENELSHSKDDEASEDQLHEIFHEVDETKDQVDELSHPVGNDDADDEVDELSHPIDDEVDDLLHPVDDDDDEVDDLSHPVDDDDDEVDDLSHPVDDDDDEVDDLSHPVDDDDEVDDLSHPVDDDDDEVDDLSHPVDDDDDEVDDLSHPVDDDDDEVDDLSHPVDDDDDEVDDLSHPVDDDDDEVDDLSHPVDDDDDEVDDLSHPVDDDDDEVDDLSHPVDDDEDEVDDLSHPVDDDEDEVDDLSHPVDDDEDEVDDLLHPVDDDLSHTVDDNTENKLDEISHPVSDDVEDELSHQVDEDGKHRVDELSHPVDETQGRTDELSQPVDENTDEVDELSRPVDDDAEVKVGKSSHPIDETQSRVEEISHPVDGTQVQVDEFATSEEGVLDSKDFHADQETTEKGFSKLSHSTMAGVDGELVVLDDSTENQEGAFIQSVDGDASESREDELISEGDDVDSESFRLDKLSPEKVIEDLRHLNKTNTKNPFENPKNDADILPLDEQNGNESRLGKIPIDKPSVTEDLDLHKIDMDEFQGSGDMGDSFDALTDTLLDSKSGRIIDVFPRANNTVECTTPKGERGRCRSLAQCPLSDPLSNFNLFLQYVCLSRGVLVGICCPDNPVVEISDPTENSTGPPVTEFQQPIDGCGLNTNTRIVGGKVSLPHEWTWMVALLRRNRFFCGGVIINDWYILTAAHCVMGVKVKDLKVRLGEYNFNEKNEHQEDIPVSEIKRHALFVTLTFQHDIALLKLKRRIEYTKFVGSICLPNPKSGNFSNVNATVVGWGTVAFGGTASPVLRQVTVPVWDNDECDKTYRLERITDAFMCAGSPEDGEDACQGDSGGPLMALSEEGRWEVIGIVSWGRRCGDPTFPGVYTRVTSYLDWITENAN